MKLRTRIGRSLVGTVGFLVAAVAVAACANTEGQSTSSNVSLNEASNSFSPQAPGNSTEDSAESSESESLRVTTLHVCIEAPLAWGIAKGIFKEHGVNVSVVQTTGGAAGLAAIMSQSADISSTNPVSSMLAVSQGFPIKVISGWINSNPDGSKPTQSVVVRADSGIDSIADLVGKKLAINELGTGNEVLTRAWLQEGGINPDDVNILAVSFGDMMSALTSGRIDAGMLADSMVASLEGNGVGKILGNPLTDVVGPVPIAQYIATDEFIANHSDLLNKFRAGLSEAMEQVQDPANSAEYLKVTADYCKSSVEVLSKVRPVRWTTDVDLDVLGQIASLAEEQGVLKEGFDVEQIVGASAPRASK